MQCVPELDNLLYSSEEVLHVKALQAGCHVAQKTKGMLLIRGQPQRYSNQRSMHSCAGP
jgi:hypothetical protein